MKTNTADSLTRWIHGAAPESSHPSDMRRFYEVVYEYLLNEENCNQEELTEIIRENVKWSEGSILSFSEEGAIAIGKIIGFIDYLKSEKRINIYNLL